VYATELAREETAHVAFLYDALKAAGASPVCPLVNIAESPKRCTFWLGAEEGGGGGSLDAVRLAVHACMAGGNGKAFHVLWSGCLRAPRS